MLPADDIARGFGLGDVVSVAGPVARGQLGEIFRLDTARGPWAVKRLFRPADEAEVAEEIEFQERARRAGVPSPAACRTCSGGILLDIGISDDRPDERGQFRVSEWVDLAEPDDFLDPAAIGTLVAKLHGTEFSGERPVDSWFVDPVGANRWDQLAGRLDAAGAPFAADLAGLRDDIVAMEAVLEKPATLRTCHRDLHNENLRRTVGGGVCLIDWEDCGLADPSQELAAVLYFFSPAGPDGAAAIHRAYRAAGGAGCITGRGTFSMLIAQLGHINELACTRWLAAPPETQERDRAASLLVEFIHQPLTLRLIDQLVAATRD